MPIRNADLECRLSCERRSDLGGLGLDWGWDSPIGPVRGDLVFRVAHFADVGDLGVVGLAEQLNEPIRLKQRLLSASQCDHPEAQCLMRHRRLELR